MIKRQILDTHLPPAACSKEMLEQIKEVAKREETSASAVIRYAISLFLQGRNGKSRVSPSKTSEVSNGD